ncbi:MAG: hypothetical protein HEQ39_13100 [Rhizobacter sp.]
MTRLWDTDYRGKVKDRIDRLLTIEVDPQHRAVQIRGFTNRLADERERNVLARWAKARGIRLQ